MAIIIPPQLLDELRSVKGFDEVSFVAAHKQPAATSVRLHPAKGKGDLFPDAAKVPWCDTGLYLPERPVFTLDPAFHAGAYYVQEASSMFLDHVLRTVLKDRTGLRVLDLCGAPGGKSTLIASLLDKESLLVSNEVIRSRAPILEENVIRWGYTNNWVSGNDPADFGKLTGYFDVIVVDAPCSGSGLWRKDERALDEWSEANVHMCSARQQRIMADVWPALKQNGILVYATCSYSPQEDEDILDWLASEYDVTSLPVPVKDEWGIVSVVSEKQMSGYRFFPGKVRGEGFFIAAVQKREDAGVLRQQRFKPAHDKKLQAQTSYLLASDDHIIMETGKETISALQRSHEADFHLLKQAVYLRKAGINLGSPSAKEWLPSHDIALSLDRNRELPFVEVSKEQALRFLKREDFGMSELPKGWLLVQYQGLALGWIKSLGNRVNNYLPKHWRIRMDID
jgi:16S rRNA C967 or C1407 C5-methylase (RsmB/RsmF family)/NOL1/NOP2/fmu family ribosome biogenesis protein